MQQDSTANTSLFVLPQSMNIDNIESLASELKDFLSSKKSILTIDAAKVENITTAGLQLIVSLEKTMSSAGGILVVKNGSESFVNAFKDEGLENLCQQSLSGGN